MRPRTIHLLWMTSALAASVGADDQPGSAPCSQETSVVGTVRSADTGSPLAEVVVETRHARTRTESVELTDARGEYVVPTCPGEVTITFLIEAHRPETRAVVVSGAPGTRVDMTMVRSPDDGIAISHPAPLIDAASSSTGASIRVDDFLRRYPLR